jgi:hypothetical protein
LLLGWRLLGRQFFGRRLLRRLTCPRQCFSLRLGLLARGRAPAAAGRLGGRGLSLAQVFVERRYYGRGIFRLRQFRLRRPDVVGESQRADLFAGPRLRCVGFLRHGIKGSGYRRVQFTIEYR